MRLASVHGLDKVEYNNYHITYVLTPIECEIRIRENAVCFRRREFGRCFPHASWLIKGLLRQGFPVARFQIVWVQSTMGVALLPWSGFRVGIGTTRDAQVHSGSQGTH